MGVPGGGQYVSISPGHGRIHVLHLSTRMMERRLSYAFKYSIDFLYYVKHEIKGRSSRMIFPPRWYVCI